jgi:hypothetical protein
MPLPTTAFPCCRDHDLFWPIGGHAQAIQRGPADEAYWFSWTTESSGEGNATIRVARLGTAAMFFRSYRPSTFGRPRRGRGMLSRSDWMLIEDAVVAANFWMLDAREEHRLVLDGTTWYLAGRRRRDYHFISRRSPRGALWDLGRCRQIGLQIGDTDYAQRDSLFTKSPASCPKTVPV